MRPYALLLLGLAACNDPVGGPVPAAEIATVGTVSGTGVPGAVLRDTIRVQVLDGRGRPLAGRSVHWVIRQGGGTVTAVQDTTDLNGEATALWRLGSATALNVLEANTDEGLAVRWQAAAHAFRVDALASDYSLACGLVSGDLWCWGQDAWVTTDPPSVTETGYGFQALYQAPGLVAAGQGFTAVAVGWLAVCAIDAGGVVHCYGLDGNLRPIPELPTVPPMRQVTGEVSGEFCGLALADSTAWCWTKAGTGAQVPGSPAFRRIEVDWAGQVRGCGLRVDSTAACWGPGYLGDGTADPAATPVAVLGGHRFVELAVGRDFSCGREADRDVWCWGVNDAGQLGRPGPEALVPVLATSNVTAIAAADRTVFAMTPSGPVRWGATGRGSSAIRPFTIAGSPPQVTDFADGNFSCVRLQDQQVYCMEEIWSNVSAIEIDRFMAVQPLRN